MARFIVGICVAWALVGCDTDRIRGDRAEFLGQPVAANVLTDDDRVRRVLITLPFQAVQDAPTGPTAGPALATIDLPSQVQEQTFAKFFQIAWNQAGDPRSVPAPNFALRFFGVPQQNVNAVVCTQQPPVATNRIPSGFILAPVEQACATGQAWRATDGTSASGRAVIFGFNNGQLILIEVQVARDILLSQQPFIMSIPRPAELGTSTLFPTRLIGNFRSDINAWEFALDEFVQISQ